MKLFMYRKGNQNFAIQYRRIVQIPCTNEASQRLVYLFEFHLESFLEPTKNRLFSFNFDLFLAFCALDS
jgi:hypothetical protein